MEGDVCTVTVNGGTETNAGSYEAVAALDNPNYTIADSAAISYTIEKAAQTITLSAETISGRIGNTKAVTWIDRHRARAKAMAISLFF